jgi:outer membrane protein TolC
MLPRKWFHLFLFFLVVPALHGQTPLTLEACLEAAVQTDLRQRQFPLLEQQKELQLQQVEIQRRPSLRWSTLAQVQSEVVDFPFDLPPTFGDPLDLPLYRVQSQLEAQYLLYDGGRSQHRKQVIETGAQVPQASLESQIDRIKVQVQSTYFAILQQEAYENILMGTLEALGLQEKRVEALIQEGVALPIDRQRLEVQQLAVEGKIAAIRSEVSALQSLLSDLTGLTFSETPQLQIPVASAEGTELQRSELAVFQAQEALIDEQLKGIDLLNRPTLSVFAQGGVGYPNPLNFFDEAIAPFAIGGLRFNWNLLNWGNKDQERQLIAVEQAQIQLQREAFIEQNDRESLLQQARIAGLREQLLLEEEVVRKQKTILQTLEKQLELGVASTTDYLLQLNTTSQAELQLAQLELQLIQQKTAFLIHRGAL